MKWLPWSESEQIFKMGYSTLLLETNVPTIPKSLRLTTRLMTHVFKKAKLSSPIKFFVNVAVSTVAFLVASVPELDPKLKQIYVRYHYWSGLGAAMSLGSLTIALFHIFAPVLQKIYNILLKLTFGYRRRVKSVLSTKATHMSWSVAWAFGFLGMATGAVLFWYLIPKDFRRAIRGSVTSFLTSLLINCVMYFIFLVAEVILLKSFFMLSCSSGVDLRDPKAEEKLRTIAGGKEVWDAYKVATSITPSLAQLKVVYKRCEGDLPNAFAFAHGGTKIVATLGPITDLLTREQLIAVLLHELGHIITLGSPSLFWYIIEMLLSDPEVSVLAAYGAHRIARYVLGGKASKSVSMVTAAHLLNGIRASFRRFREEMIADSYAVACGYGQYLIDALRAISSAHTKSTKSSSATKSYVKFALRRLATPFALHLVDLETRIEMIKAEMKAAESIKAKSENTTR